MEVREPGLSPRREIPIGTCTLCGRPDAQWVLDSAETPGLCRECARSVLAEKRRKRLMGAGVIGTLAVLIAVVWIGAYVAAHRDDGTPKPSLRSLGAAIKAGDRTTFARYMDVAKVEQDLNAAADRVARGGAREVSSDMTVWYAASFSTMFADDPASETVSAGKALVAYDVPTHYGAPACRVLLRCEQQVDAHGAYWRVTGLGNPDEIVGMFSRPVTPYGARAYDPQSADMLFMDPGVSGGYYPNGGYPNGGYPNGTTGRTGIGGTGSGTSGSGGYGGSQYIPPSTPVLPKITTPTKKTPVPSTGWAP